MPAIPNKTGAGSLTDAATTNLQQKNNFGALYDYLVGLFGTDGTKATALATLLVDAAAAAYVPLTPQCRLEYVSTTAIKLARCRGNLVPLWDGSKWVYRALSAEPTASNGSMGGNWQVRSIYAYWTGAAVALEVSATGCVFDSDGMPYKSGDKTRLYVGVAATNGSGVFEWSGAVKYVSSYWNKRRLTVADYAAPSVNNPATGVWVAQGLVRFVLADDSFAVAHYSNTSYNTATNHSAGAGLAFDAASPGVSSFSTSPSLNTNTAAAINIDGALAAGVHYAQSFVYTGNANSIFYGTTQCPLVVHYEG